MDDFVSKPVDVEALGAALAARTNTSRRGSGASTEPPTILDPDQLAVLRSIGPDDGRGLLPAVAESFIAQAPQLLAQLRRASGEDDRAEMREVAHQLKGVAASAGAFGVTAVCQELESAAGPPSEVNRLLEELASRLTHASRALSDLVDR
jgi:HPt (histidine-containing phosphotransfer) domain-containing protein